MLDFRPQMDPHSVDVYRGENFLGFAQWHGSCQRRFSPFIAQDISLDELEEIAAFLRRQTPGHPQR